MSGATPLLENFGKEMTVSIVGTVIDDLGHPVPKATISLLTGEVTVTRTSSDKNGEFAFLRQPVKVGLYTLRAKKPFYDSSDETLTLSWEMADSPLDVVLRLSSNPRLALADPNAPKKKWRTTDSIDDAFRSPQASWPASSKESPASQEKPKYVHVRVLYATDRNRVMVKDSSTPQDPTKMFDGEWAKNEDISFGACEVQLPYDRKIGDVARPSIFKLEFREDPNKHLLIKSCEDLDPDRFFQEVSDRGPSVLFFVHGHCVTFAEAIYKTAQIADDVRFAGAPICYSWPSNGHFYGYTKDEDSIIWTRRHLVTVLRKIMQITRIQTINIIAHSMGNRAVIECLDDIAQELERTGKASQINEVVFAAPDVNSGIFRQFLDTIRDAGKQLVGKRLTLYASSNDKPLKWSQWFRNWDRAGQGGPKLLLHPLLDSIDASHVRSGVLDHSYFGESIVVLNDLQELFIHNTAPPRFAINGPRNDGKGDYWEFRRG